MTNAPEMFTPLTEEEIAAGARLTDDKPTVQKTPVIPVPDDAPPMRFRHPKYGEPKWSWAYHDAAGRLVGYVCRWDYINGEGEPAKHISPVTYCDLSEDGRPCGRAWRSKGVPRPRPLYKLPEILARPDAAVLVTEGEKDADAADQLFPDMVATTPMHGAKSPHLADWTTLAGRTVVVATDFDEPGRTDDNGRPLHPGADFGNAVVALLRAAGADEVLHLRPERLAQWIWRDGERQQRGAPIPDGWGAANALDDGWTAEAVQAEHASGDLFVPFEESGADEGDGAANDDQKSRPYEWSFRVGPNGVRKLVEKQNKETGEVEPEWRWFCSHLDILAETRDADGENWGRLVAVIDRDGTRHEWAMPMGMLAGSGEAYRDRLLSLGLVMGSGKPPRDYLHEYLSGARPKAKARCVSRIGWHNGAFVLPDQTLGVTNGERVLLQSRGEADHAFRTRGTLADWQHHVARLAAGNSRLVFSISAAFAAPLLYLIDGESGGFHLRGASSIGKSTALVVAGSVWGGRDLKGYVKQWRATDNALEAIAQGHSDALLCLDELSQIDARAAGATAYMLANGAGKSRASRSGDGRKVAEWRLLFLSTGEIGIADKLAEDGRGRRATAGQQVRVLDIPADPGAGFGLFGNLHDFTSADAFARHLKQAANSYYGTAARAFIEEAAAEREVIQETVAAFVNEFTARACPDGADGQVLRAAQRFGLVAAAGELAAAKGIVPWTHGPDSEALKSASACFRDWLAARGGVEPAEVFEGLSQVRRFLELHGESRFAPFDIDAVHDRDGTERPESGGRATINRVGFRKRHEGGGEEFYVLPEVWRSEVCAGFDAQMIARAMAERGWLQRGEGKNLAATVRLPVGKKRAYVIKPEFICDDDGI